MRLRPLQSLASITLRRARMHPPSPRRAPRHPALLLSQERDSSPSVSTQRSPPSSSHHLSYVAVCGRRSHSGGGKKRLRCLRSWAGGHQLSVLSRRGSHSLQIVLKPLAPLLHEDTLQHSDLNHAVEPEFAEVVAQLAPCGESPDPAPER